MLNKINKKKNKVEVIALKPQVVEPMIKGGIAAAVLLGSKKKKKGGGKKGSKKGGGSSSSSSKGNKSNKGSKGNKSESSSSKKTKIGSIVGVLICLAIIAFGVKYFISSSHGKKAMSMASNYAQSYNSYGNSGYPGNYSAPTGQGYGYGY